MSVCIWPVSRYRMYKSMRSLKPFMCKLCRLGFDNHSRWKQHMYHHKQKRIRSTIKQKSYKYSQNQHCVRTKVKVKSNKFKAIEMKGSTDKNISPNMMNDETIKIKGSADKNISPNNMTNDEAETVPTLSSTEYQDALRSVQLDHDYGTKQNFSVSGTNARGALFKCKFCNASYSDLTEIKAHVQIHVRVLEKGFTCTCGCCAQEFPDFRSFGIHATVHRQEREVQCIFNCQVCGKNFTSWCTIKEHLMMHAKNVNDIQCKLCNRYYTKRTISGHLATCQTKPYSCNVCKARFAHMEDCTKHAKLHENANGLKCRYCDKVFPKSRALIKHLSRHTNGKPYDCEYCDALFATNKELLVHVYETHRDAQTQYRCQICGKTFVRKMGLVMHMRLHEEKTFVCELCGEKCRTENELQRHLKKHNEVKEKHVFTYQCDLCGKCLANSLSLKTHRLEMHIPDGTPLPYPCRYCPKSYARLDKRKVHERTHTGERPFKCIYCAKGFYTRDACNQHQKNIHSKMELNTVKMTC